MTKRLEILKGSLNKKEALFNDKLNQHFNSVKLANGQPLNDKRNGQSTLNKWERENQALRKLQESINITKMALEKEEGKISSCSYYLENLPVVFSEYVNSGDLVQWRKHPSIFFVNGVKKARIGWDKKKKVVYHKFYSSIECEEEKKKFRNLFNDIHKRINNEK